MHEMWIQMEGVLSSFPYLDGNKCCFHMVRFQSSASSIQLSRRKFRQQIPDFKSIDSTDETVESDLIHFGATIKNFA